jgi:predicted alpha/beta hydrolase family esterase
MKRAVIVHCWGGEPNYAWYPWVAKHLEAKGLEVSVPEMPGSEEPKLDKWLAHLKDVIGEPDEDLDRTQPWLCHYHALS